MSVSLLIKSKKGSELIPIATEQFFKKYWSPLCKKFNLKYTPLFETGLTIEKTELPEVLEEFWIIKDVLQSKNRVNEESIQIIKRCNLVIDKLQGLNEKDSYDIFIG